MQEFHVYGSAGGTGTTTTACTLAALASHQGHRVTLVDRSGDALAMMGHARTPVPGFVVNDAVVALGSDLAVFDHGRNLPENVQGTKVLTVRSDYMSARGITAACRPDYIVMLHRDGAVLGVADMAAVAGIPTDRVLVVKADPVFARAIDAGLIMSRVIRDTPLASLLPTYEASQRLY